MQQARHPAGAGTVARVASSSLGALLARGLVFPSYRLLSFGFFLSTVFLILGLGHGDVPPWAAGLLLVSFLNLAGPFTDL
jgi:hypothetical protein